MWSVATILDNSGQGDEIMLKKLVFEDFRMWISREFSALCKSDFHRSPTKV